MSTVLHPVGPQPPRVYWRRRLVLLVAVVVLFLVLGTIVRAWIAPGGAEEQPAPTASPSAPVDTTPAGCTADALTVTASTPKRVHGPEDLVHLAVTVTNTGTVACTVDLGLAAIGVAVTSGSDRVWSSADCPAEPPPPGRLLLLAPEAREAAEVTWARERSAPDCPGVLPAPRPGTYRATVTVEASVSEPVVFELQ